MENRRNYYRVLQVQPGAPVEIIRAGYRTLMQRLRAHPDLGGDHRHATLINEAYAVLTDPARRAEYDREMLARLLVGRGEETVKDGSAAWPGLPEPDAITCLFCATPQRAHAQLHADALCTECHSPLYPARRGSPDLDGRRAIERIARDYPLRVFTSWPQAGYFAARTRDLSLHGISFVILELLAPHAIVKLDSDVCQAVAQVANTRLERQPGPANWLVGARFLSVVFPRSRGSLLSARA